MVADKRGRGRGLRALGVLASLAALAVAAGCGPSEAAAAVSSHGVVSVVAAENEYGSVAAQVGGRYASVVSVESNPNTDPHTYEVSPDVARQVSGAGVVIQNGVGYDAFMNRIEAASPSRRRKVIDVQHLLGLPSTTPNPHLWYDPRTMPAVAEAIADDLSALDPGHARYFQANLAAFDTSLRPWLQAIARFRAEHAGTPAATTEPVADYLLEAMGIDNRTPIAFQADVMNGTDPTPQGVAFEDRLLAGHQVKVFAYNEQVADSLTEAIRSEAERSGVPVVGVYETMPTGYDYQRWMLAETTAIERAVVAATSTPAVTGPGSEGGDGVLSVEGVGVALSGRTILSDVTFSVGAGELIGLIGSNGAGKTTLLRVILGLQRPTAGRVRVAGRSRRARPFGYVPQKVALDPDLPMRARDLVALGVDGHRFGVPLHSKGRRDRADEMLAAVDAGGFADSRVGRLSGGEQQRVLIAHALACRPRLLLLDEPLANLDLRAGQEIVALLHRITADRGVTVLLSAHEMNPLLPVMDRVVYLAAGHAATGTTDEVVRTDVLSRLYGHHVDVVRLHGRVLVVPGAHPPGEAPVPAHPPIEVS